MSPQRTGNSAMTTSPSIKAPEAASDDYFIALRAVITQLQHGVPTGTWTKVQNYVVQQMRHAEMETTRQHAVEQWLRGGISSAVGGLPLIEAQAVLHYAYVALSEYLGPCEADNRVGRAVQQADERTAHHRARAGHLL